MLRGEVVPGDGRGRVLGFPTANLRCHDGVLPDDGIYAVWVRIDDDPTPRAGTVSVGTNPTFAGERERRVEVHLHAVDVDLYGRTLAVELVAYLRPTLCFADADALIAQSVIDIADSDAALAR
ncbi:riboflavin kinase [Microbacterium sp. SSW1-49]|uniref:riboflavin kinase n=2 Tax=Microbacterium croceum TaxID=2851645 RepID=A0ABT0FIR6_9MICO|nr:riboflavin kinase [Microbacterium croceum]